MLYKQLRAALIPHMKQLLGLPIIEANGEGRAPPGTFITFDCPQPMGQPAGMPIETFGADGRKVIRQEAIVTLTFMVYAEDRGDCLEWAVKAADYLQTDGYRKLKDADIVFVECAEIQSNDLKLGDTWEYRAMFDADFRLTHTSTAAGPLETIDTADVRGAF